MTSNSRQTRTAASTDSKTLEAADTARPTKTFMDRWVEPPLRAPAPSFMDYPHLSIERHGVLENMAPLGTNPSSKLKKTVNVRLEGMRRLAFTTKRDTSASAATTPREASTPEPTISHSRRRSDSRKMEDADYIPKTPVGQGSGRRSTVRVSVPRQSLPPQASPHSLSTSPAKKEHGLEKMDRVIIRACEDALREGRMPTAYALRTLYNDYRSNPRITSIMESVFLQQASSDQTAEFQKLMGRMKREGRKGGNAKYWEVHDSNTSNMPPSIFRPVNFNVLSKRTVVDGAAADGTAQARSPRKDAAIHVSKRHKSSHHRKGSGEVNGGGGSRMNNGSHARGRSDSHCSTSSLSSLDEEILGGPYSPSSAAATTNQACVQAHQTRAAASLAQAGASTGARASSPSAQQQPGPGTDSILHTRTSSRLSNHGQPMAASQHNSKTPGPRLHAWNTANALGAAAAGAGGSGGSGSAAGAGGAAAGPGAGAVGGDAGAAGAAASTAHAPPLVPVANHNMPAYYADSSSSATPSSNLPQQASHGANLRSLKKAPSPVVRNLDDDDRTIRLKRRAREITENKARIHESFDRHQASTKEAESESEAGDSIAVINQKSKPVPVLRFRSSQAIKKTNDESDDLSSPTLLSFQADLAPGSVSNSRAGTPSIPNRPSRKAKSGPRMKTSPMKKKAGPSAGIPRASGERNSPAGNGSFPHGQDDNDDYCSSCGGNGDLVCCDGCTRSFHFKCVDPPMSESQLPDNWFCNTCNISRNPRITEFHGLFSSLLTILQKKNPSAFHLPKDVREYFEGVRTGSEGEYEDGPVATTKSKRGAGYEEVPDYLKLKDPKGNWILCHECRKGAGNGRPIIPCSYCGLQWHLDCLDPPMANPPPPGKLWRCPCHVDDLLAKLPGLLGPAHRFRKIKGASVDRPAFARGFRNSGYIEIELAGSDNEDDGFFDQVEFGRVYKLPEEGIKLDFISRIRDHVGRRDYALPPIRNTLTPTRSEPPPMGRYSIFEQQAALNIAQFAQQDQTHGQPGDSRVLVDALITLAPTEVVSMIAQADTSKIFRGGAGQKERQALIAMRALIDQSLKAINDMETITVDDGTGAAKIKETQGDVDMLL